MLGSASQMVLSAPTMFFLQLALHIPTIYIVELVYARPYLYKCPVSFLTLIDDDFKGIVLEND